MKSLIIERQLKVYQSNWSYQFDVTPFITHIYCQLISFIPQVAMITKQISLYLVFLVTLISGTAKIVKEKSADIGPDTCGQDRLKLGKWWVSFLFFKIFPKNGGCWYEVGSSAEKTGTFVHFYHCPQKTHIRIYMGRQNV